MISLLIILAILKTGQFQKTETYDLEVRVIDFKNSEGHVVGAVFNSDKTFLNKPVRSIVLPVQESREVTSTFSKLPPGQYAISIYHDKNSNKKLDTNILGIPIEDYGFSNNAKGKFGPPQFKQCMLNLTGDKKITIKLNN